MIIKCKDTSEGFNISENVVCRSKLLTDLPVEDASTTIVLPFDLATWQVWLAGGPIEHLSNLRHLTELQKVCYSISNHVRTKAVQAYPFVQARAIQLKSTIC
jgi:hypothetical protein